MTLRACVRHGKNLDRVEVARLNPGRGGGLETVEEKRRLEMRTAGVAELDRMAKTDLTIVAAMALCRNCRGKGKGYEGLDSFCGGFKDDGKII